MEVLFAPAAGTPRKRCGHDPNDLVLATVGHDLSYSELG
jgi:hypothetical protein